MGATSAHGRDPAGAPLHVSHRSATTPTWVSWVLAGAVGLVAVALRAGPVLSGAGLTAFYRYDSGVYFAAAVALHEGFVPYRDFLLLHPPGILLALAPFAALASSLGDQGAMVAARVSFMVLGGLAAALICQLLRSYGWVAALIGGLFYAGYGPAVYVERSTGLEALASFLTVAGLCLLMPGLRGRRRVGWLVAAGTILVASGLLSRNLANGCPVVVDLSGYQYHVAEGGPVGTGNAAWQRFTLDYLGSGKSTLLLRSTIRGWLSADSLATIKTWPVVGRVSEANVREPVR